MQKSQDRRGHCMLVRRHGVHSALAMSSSARGHARRAEAADGEGWGALNPEVAAEGLGAVRRRGVGRWHVRPSGRAWRPYGHPGRERGGGEAGEGPRQAAATPTIYALATAGAGPGSRSCGISGGGRARLAIADRPAAGDSPAAWCGRRFVRRCEVLDRGLAVPVSVGVTGEHVVELHLHGGRAVAAAVLEALGRTGVLLAGRAGGSPRAALSAYGARTGPRRKRSPTSSRRTRLPSAGKPFGSWTARWGAGRKGWRALCLGGPGPGRRRCWIFPTRACRGAGRGAWRGPGGCRGGRRGIPAVVSEDG